MCCPLVDVLLRFVLQARLPGRDDQVMIRTWPSGHTRAVATREFVGTDADGREMFRAGSEWMVVNKQTSRLKNLVRLGLDLPDEGQKALSGELKRLERRQGYHTVDRIRVPHSSIDLNGHVNNTEYVRWGLDALRRAFKLGSHIRSVQATYLSEVFEADEVEIAVASDGDERFHVLASKPDEDTTVYLMEVVC